MTWKTNLRKIYIERRRGGKYEKEDKRPVESSLYINH